MKKKTIPRNAVKEAFDNLPSGICFFKENGIPVLCNRKMHRIIFELTGKDLQFITDLTDALENPPEGGKAVKDGEDYILSDGSVWNFTLRKTKGENTYIECLATDITELYQKKQALEKSTAEHQEVIKTLRSLSDNVLGISRETESLEMKMRVHRDTGIALQKLCDYLEKGKNSEDKHEVISSLDKLVDYLSAHISESADLDDLTEIMKVASSFGLTIEIQGTVPERERERVPIIKAMWECMTNIRKHAGGDTMYVSVTEDGAYRRVRITNNGAVPTGPIVEGGGFSSLRKRIEKIGGIMTVESSPVFALNITVVSI